MKSSQENLQDIASAFGSQEIFIDAFMVFWMFIDSNNIMSVQEKNRIGSLYKNIMPIRTEGKVNYFPLVQSIDQFYQKLTKLKIKNKMTKIVIDSINAEYILDRVINHGGQAKPNVVYIIATTKHEKHKSLGLVQKYKDMDIQIFKDINTVIEKAQKDLNKWINKFEILRNMFPLEQNTFQEAFQRRVKLYACRNLDPNKYDLYLHQFRKYVFKMLPTESIQRQNIQNALRQAITIKKEILRIQKQVPGLKNKMKNSPTEQLNQLEILLAEANKSISTHYKSFVNIMLDLYKGKSYFYEIINKGLKKIGSKQFAWQQLALPFSFLHEAILYKFQHSSQELIQQIISKKEYTLYRGGKMSLAQSQDIQKNYKNNPFYQSLSFTSTSKSKEKALKFLSSTEHELNKVNCLFKYIIKPPKKMDNPSFRRFLMQSFCQIQNNSSQQQDQVLLNSMTVGKVINIRKQRVTKNYDNITVITIQIGSFEELFIAKQNNNIYEDRNIYKDIINHFKHTMELVLKFQEFSFSSAYELCNQMQKSYKYIENEITRLNDECQMIGQNNENKQLSQKRLSFFYSQQNYYSKLAQICRKMGNLTEASIHAQNAINKYKQLDNIDNNKIFRIHQQKLDKMYLVASQILIQKHNFRKARQMIMEKISQLQKEQDPIQRQRNQVLISRMKLDLGTVNFKQGKTQEAKKLFGQSSEVIDKIFTSINYEGLQKETFWFDWVKGWFTDTNVKIFEGTQVYFKKRRQQLIQKATKLYGSQNRLLYLKNSANSLSNEIVQAVNKHKEYFEDSSQYQNIIKEINNKVDEKIDKSFKKSIQNDPNVGLVLQYISQKDQNEQQQYNIMNSHKRLKQQMDKNFTINQKSNLTDIRNQQKMIYSQKQSIQEKYSQFWKNPDIYFQSPQDFQQQFSQNMIKKQKQNRQALLKHSDQITIEELSAYYKDSAKVIQTYIKDLQQWGFQGSAPKVLQQYNNLIKLYIEIDCQTDAQKKIEQLKRIANYNKESKYYELAVAYFLSGKIRQNCTDRDYIYMERRDEEKTKGQKPNALFQKKDSYDQFRLQKANAALQQFQPSQQNFQSALIFKEQKYGKIQQSREAYDAQPQQVELKIWKMKSLLVKFQLQKCQEAKNQLYDQILDLKSVIQQGLKKIKTSNADEIQAQFKQTNAIFYYFRKQYDKCFQQFNSCLNIRANKLGQCNWQNTLTMLKIINYFQYSSSQRQKILAYKVRIQDSYVKFKSYPFFWKISLANYYLNKDCQKNSTQMLKTIQYLQNALHHLKKIGFVQKSLYSQYCQIYDLQYSQFYQYAKPYLQSRLKLIKYKMRQQRNNNIRVTKTLKKIQPQVPNSSVIESDGRIQQKQSNKLMNPPMLKHRQSSFKEDQIDMSRLLSNPSPKIFLKRQKTYQKKLRQDFEQMTEKSIQIKSPSKNQLTKQQVQNSLLHSLLTKNYKSTYYSSTQPSTKIAPNSGEIPSSPYYNSFNKKRNSSRNSYHSRSKYQHTNGINIQMKSQMAILQARRSTQNRSVQQKYLPLSHNISQQRTPKKNEQKISQKKLRKTFLNATPFSNKSTIKHQKEILQNPQRSFYKIGFQQDSKQLQYLNKISRHIKNSRIKKKL